MKKNITGLRRPLAAFLAVLLAVGLAFEGGDLTFASEERYGVEEEYTAETNEAGENDIVEGDMIEDNFVEDNTAGDITEDPPTEDIPSGDIPADTPSADNPPAEDSPAEELPAETPPAEEPPAEQPPAENETTPAPEEKPPAALFDITMTAPAVADTEQFIFEYKLAYPAGFDSLPSPEGLFVLSPGESQSISGVPDGTAYVVFLTVPEGFVADHTLWCGTVAAGGVSICPNISAVNTGDVPGGEELPGDTDDVIPEEDPGTGNEIDPGVTEIPEEVPDVTETPDIKVVPDIIETPNDESTPDSTETPETDVPENDGTTIEDLKKLDKDTVGAAVEYNVISDQTGDGVFSDSVSGGRKWTFDMYYVNEEDLHHVHEENDFSVKYQMEFHTNQFIPKYGVEIRIPMALLESRDGVPFLPSEIAVPLVENKDQYVETKNSPFNCYIDGDELVFFNYKDIKAGTNAAWQVVYRDIDIMEIEDETEWDLQANVTVTYTEEPDENDPGTGEPQTVTETIPPVSLTGDVDTYATLLDLKKRPFTSGGISYTPGLYTEKQVEKFLGGSLPEKYSGENFGKYKYVVWEVTANGRGTQPFDLWMKDATSYEEGTAGEVVGYSSYFSDTEFPSRYDETLQESLNGYQNVSEKSEQRSWNQKFYVVTAYPADIEEGTILENDVDMTLVPYDMKDENSQKTAHAEWGYQKYDWEYQGDIIGISKDGRPVDVPGWIEVFRQSIEKNEDRVPEFNFSTSSTCRSFKITHEITGDTVGNRREGASVRIVTVDDAVYVYPNGTGGTLLTGDDYYFSSVSVTQTDRGYDIYEDIGGDPETTDEDYVDQGLRVYAMFADTDGNGTMSTDWEEVGYTQWNPSGSMRFNFSTSDIAKKPYRVMAVHDTINYTTSCTINATLHLRPDSQTLRKIFEENPDMSIIQFENVSGVSGQQLSFGEPGDGIGTQSYFESTPSADTESYFHDSSIGESNYSEPGLDDFTTNLYGLPLMRDNAFVSGKTVEYDAGMSKTGSLKNDVVSGQSKVVYTISVNDSILVGSRTIAELLLEAGLEPPNMKSIVIYDLLPTSMKMDASYKVTATSSGGNDVDVKWELVNTNYKNTGRTLIKFIITFNGEKAYVVSGKGISQSWTLNFRGYWDWKDINRSDTTENIAAVLSNDDKNFVSEKDSSIYPDDGSGATGDFSLFGSDIDGDESTDDQVMFAESVVTGDVTVASESTVKKGVKADSSKYGSFLKSTVVEPGGNYMYEITVENTTRPITNIVVFDHLENAAIDRKDSEDEMVFEENYWHGTFSSIITQPLDDLGITYTIWYNKQRDAKMPDLDEEPADVLTEENGWKKKDEFDGSPADVQSFAVALDPSYVLGSMESVSFQVCMTAPESVDVGQTWAYNNPAFYRMVKDDEMDKQTVVGSSVRVRLGNAESLAVVKEYENENQVPPALKNKNEEFEFYAYDTTDGESEDLRVPFAIVEYKLYTKNDAGEWVEDPERHATDALGRFYLRVNQKAVFEDVPDTDRIQIVETENPFWEPHISREDLGSDAVITVKNKAIPVLYVQKKTENGTAGSDELFKFRLTINGQPAANVTYWIMNAAYTDGRVPAKKSEGTTDENGEFSLHAGEIAAVLKSGEYEDAWEIQEVDCGENWFTKEGGDRTSGKLDINGSSTSITNYYKWKDLMLTKKVTHQDLADVKEKEFSFKVELVETAEDGSETLTPVVGNDWELKAAGESGQLDEQGEFTCRAAAGVVTIHKLEAGKTYRITETQHGEFYEPVNEGTADVEAPLYAQSVSAEITNDWLKRPLKVSKILIYDYEDPTEAEKANAKVFDMTVSCDPDGTGNMSPLAEYPFTLTEGGIEVLPGSDDDPYGPENAEFKTDALGGFKIKGGQVAEFKDAGVAGSRFTVSETPDTDYPQIVPLDGQSYDDYMDKDGGEASIINGSSGNLIIRKKWIGLDDAGAAFVEAGKTGDPDLSVEITMTVTGEDGVKKQWPETDVNVSMVKDDGTVSAEVWKAGSTFVLQPWATLIINESDLAGVTAYEISESKKDQHDILVWTGEDGVRHYIMEEQKDPENDGSVTGSPQTNPEAVLTNVASEIKETSRTGKRLVDPREKVPEGTRLVIIVEKYDGNNWNPAENVTYVLGYGSDDSMQFVSDRMEHTGYDGKITLEANDDGMPWVLFPEDKVYAADVIDPVSGSMRARELLDESDPQWGHYVGVGSPANDGSYTTDISELDRNGDTVEEFFVNATVNVPVRVGKALEGKSEKDFTFVLKQITEIDGAKYTESGGISNSNYKEIIKRSVPQKGIEFEVYDMESGKLSDSGETDDYGQFRLKGDQYAELNLPSNTLWTVSEDVTAGFKLKSLEEYVDISKRDETDSPVLGKLEDNLMLIGNNTEYNRGKTYITVIMDPHSGTVVQEEGWILRNNKLYKEFVEENSIITLPEQTPTFSKGPFKGWKLGNEDEKLYAAGESVTITSEMAEGRESIVFTAVPDISPEVILYADGRLVFYEEPQEEPEGEVVNRWSGWDKNSYTESSLPPWNIKETRATATSVEFKGTISPVSTAFWFWHMEKVTEFINLKGLDTSNVTSMESMFNNVKKIAESNLEEFVYWNTSKVENMKEMFYGMHSTHTINKINKLDLSTWDVSNVTDMTSMFNAAYILIYDLSGWKPSKVQCIEKMFYASGANRIIAEDWTTNPNIKNATGVFGSTSSLFGAVKFNDSKTGGDMCTPDGGYFKAPES